MFLFCPKKISLSCTAGKQSSCLFIAVDVFVSPLLFVICHSFLTKSIVFVQKLTLSNHIDCEPLKANWETSCYGNSWVMLGERQYWVFLKTVYRKWLKICRRDKSFKLILESKEGYGVQWGIFLPPCYPILLLPLFKFSKLYTTFGRSKCF